MGSGESYRKRNIEDINLMLQICNNGAS